MSPAQPTNPPEASAPAKTLEIPASVVVRELAELLHTTPIEVIKELMKQGVMASINQSVSYDAAAIVASQMGFEPHLQGEEAVTVERREVQEDTAKLQHRPPVVTVMGHVDHGKTSILDAIRKTNVTGREAGGITQHIGAYQVEIDGQKITFVDTPGHEAFTAMRARGATVTDIAILVVAADDGVMPQTLEAIDHAKAAGVPIIVAINKVDLPDANPDRVKQQLAERELLIEEWGGDVIAIPVSAKTGDGLKDLLEHILLVAEVSELKADPDRPAEGTIIESELDPSRGPMATTIVRTGTLRVGDSVVAGDTWGRVKAMFGERGQRLKAVGPSSPAKIMGLSDVPRAGDTLIVVADERAAREVMDVRERERGAAAQRATLEAFSSDVAAGRAKELNVVLKADVQGSLEALQQALEGLASDRARVRVIHIGTGKISESDVMLARASSGVIIGFNVRSEPGAVRIADAEGVDIRHYDIIYRLTEDIERALKGIMEPITEEVIDGHAEVRAVFKVRGGRVAGCMVTDGLVRRNSQVRVKRGDEVVRASRVSSLRRFQEDVREVQTGLECGIGIEGFSDVKEGDVIEAFHTETRG
ncbi:MAG: translation initiation factor IF-2 [Candidatus Rokubacteria bacterium RIFCSPLOWO2_12_FULL_71_22]|nr:MAG: translation initiation factor IF-2 [Candidatus Rokubacteria bacterium RIFCSPLOWO2_12_FULL_71_22]